MTGQTFDRQHVAGVAKEAVAAVGPMEAARVFNYKLDNLPADPGEAQEVAYMAGASCAHAVAAFSENRDGFSFSDAQPLRDLSAREFADPAVDDAFIRGIADTNP
jgi:hypothetical protein